MRMFQWKLLIFCAVSANAVVNPYGVPNQPPSPFSGGHPSVKIVNLLPPNSGGFTPLSAIRPSSQHFYGHGDLNGFSQNGLNLQFHPISLPQRDHLPPINLNGNRDHTVHLNLNYPPPPPNGFPGPIPAIPGGPLPSLPPPPSAQFHHLNNGFRFGSLHSDSHNLQPLIGLPPIHHGYPSFRYAFGAPQLSVAALPHPAPSPLPHFIPSVTPSPLSALLPQSFGHEFHQSIPSTLPPPPQQHSSIEINSAGASGASAFHAIENHQAQNIQLTTPLPTIQPGSFHDGNAITTTASPLIGEQQLGNSLPTLPPSTPIPQLSLGQLSDSGAHGEPLPSTYQGQFQQSNGAAQFNQAQGIQFGQANGAQFDQANAGHFNQFGQANAGQLHQFGQANAGQFGQANAGQFGHQFGQANAGQFNQFDQSQFAHLQQPQAPINANFGAFNQYQGGQINSGLSQYQLQQPQYNIQPRIPLGLNQFPGFLSQQQFNDDTQQRIVNINSQSQGLAQSLSHGADLSLQQQQGLVGQQSSGQAGEQYYNNLDNPSLVKKDIYVHLPPPELDADSRVNSVPQFPALPPPQKHYKIIFIKAPSSGSSQIVQRTQQAQEEKTIVYVLVRKPENKNVILPPPPPPVSNKPEVYFIKYKSQSNQHSSGSLIANEPIGPLEASNSDATSTSFLPSSSTPLPRGNIQTDHDGSSGLLPSNSEQHLATSTYLPPIKGHATYGPPN